jgi:hypothetical protein
MLFKYDSPEEESLAKGGTFDITGTGAVIDKQFATFTPSDGAVLAVIKGVSATENITLFTLAEIRAVEVDLASLFLTALTDALTGDLYRVKGYIITNIQLTSGTIHANRTINQVTT